MVAKNAVIRHAGADLPAKTAAPDRVTPLAETPA
jgi:hypothetical protein